MEASGRLRLVKGRTDSSRSRATSVVREVLDGSDFLRCGFYHESVLACCFAIYFECVAVYGLLRVYCCLKESGGRTLILCCTV